MLIRKPVSEVFEAFVNPDITTKFWFTRSDGKLNAGGKVEWHWEMYGVSTLVSVLELEENKRIRIQWGEPGEEENVEWTFTPYEGNSTYVKIYCSGFAGTADEKMAKALDSMGGFTTVLDGAKAWLEHGIVLNLILDKYPKGLTTH